MDFERVVLTDCCHAADLDYNTLYDIAKITGPGIRFLNSALKRWVKIHRYPQIQTRHRLAVWSLAKDMKTGRLRMPVLQPGEKWWLRLEYIGLADMDIDGGRTAAATLTDLRSGQTNWLTELGSRGIFWKRGIRQNIAEVVFAEVECIKAEQAAGLPAGRITPERVFPDRFEPLALPVPDPEQTNLDPNLPDPGDETEPGNTDP